MPKTNQRELLRHILTNEECAESSVETRHGKVPFSHHPGTRPFGRNKRCERAIPSLSSHLTTTNPSSQSGALAYAVHLLPES